jgi:hypothetical protein
MHEPWFGDFSIFAMSAGPGRIFWKKIQENDIDA